MTLNIKLQSLTLGDLKYFYEIEGFMIYSTRNICLEPCSYFEPTEGI